MHNELDGRSIHTISILYLYYTISVSIRIILILSIDHTVAIFYSLFDIYMYTDYVIIQICHHCSGNHMIIIIAIIIYPIITIIIYPLIIIIIHLCYHCPGDHTTVKSKRSSSSNGGLSIATQSYERYFELYKDYEVDETESVMLML